MKPVHLLLILSLLACHISAIAGEKGYLGVALSVEGEGFFLNPTLKSIKIEKVTPNSPAARAGIEAGDFLVEIEGKKIAGAKANELKPYLEREVGQRVHLAVKKNSGDVKQLEVVAGPKVE
jgi:C-terminal processing protease CtpA/Prc